MPGAPAFSMELFLSTLALIGAVIITSALLSGLVQKTGLPQVAVFLAIGTLIGPAGLNFLDAGLRSPMLEVVGTLSLVLVLFTDAVSLNLADVRKHKLLSVLMVGPGALVTALLIALIAWWLLGLGPVQSVILGAAIASTDPVLLRALLGRQGLDAGVRQALRLESGLNDAVLLPMVLVGITILTEGHALTAMDWAHLGLNVLVLSPVAGAVIALAGIGMLELVRRRTGVRRDYESIYSLGLAFAAYAAAESVHGSGFLAAFAAGLTISALDVELCDCFLEYGETTAEMALMFTFVLFGTSIIWSGLGILSPWTLLFTFLVFAARPAAILPALLPVKMAWRDRALIAWFGPRGLSTLLLALLPVFAGAPDAERLLTICCLVVLFSVLLHGLSPMVLVKGQPEKPAATLRVIQPPSLEEPQAAEPPAAEKPAGSEFITIDEVRGSNAIIVDSRSDRTYDESTEGIPGAVRLNPNNAVISAREHGLPQDAVLAVLCA